MRLLTCIITCLLLVSCNRKTPEPVLTFEYDIMDSSNLFGYKVDILRGTATAVKVSTKTSRFPNNVVIPDSISKNGKKFLVTAIGWAVFKDAANIQQVILPKNLETIGDEAFMNCTSLKTIELPENLQCISSRAFMNTGLITLTIPKSVKKLEEAFSGCKDLKTVTFEESDTPLEYIGNCRLNPFRDCLIDKLYLSRPSLQLFEFPAINHLVIGKFIKKVDACNLDRVQSTITVENPSETEIKGLCKTSTYLNVRLLVPKKCLVDGIPTHWNHFAQIQGY